MNEEAQVPQVKEEKEEPKRFVAKGPMVVFDSGHKIYWLKKDSWQDKGKFLNWHESKDFAESKNVRKIGGFHDWRLPTPDEAETLYDPPSENPGKGGTVVHIDTLFPEGAFKTMWLSGDTSTRRPRYDLSEGKVVFADEYAFGSVRLCRREQVKEGKIRSRHGR